MFKTPSQSSEKIQDRFENYSKAFGKLNEIHTKSIDEISEIERDAFFQRYEFCIELSWKLIKDILEFEQIITKTPKEAIKEGVKAGILDDYYIWDEMLSTRNFSSHSYDETQIKKLFPKVFNDHFSKLLWLKDFVQKKYIT